MKINYFKPAILVLAVATFVSACSSIPTSTSLLDQARIDFVNAQNNPKVAKYAPLEMKLASEALESANKSASLQENAEKVNQLAYVAKQKIGVAQETAKQKSAEMDVQNSSKERDQMRLDQRTNEADQATANAEKAKRAAQAAQAETLLAQQKTQMAQDQANAAQADILLAQQKAQAARDEASAAQANNQQLQAQLSELAAKNTERGIVITLGDVLFATGSAQLSNDGLRTVEKLAAILKKNPQRVVLVEGYTDSVGSQAQNQQLSERRAKAVSTALLSMDLAANRVMVRGYGEAYPVAGNASTQDRQLNRRVEIVLSDIDGKVKPRQ